MNIAIIGAGSFLAGSIIQKALTDHRINLMLFSRDVNVSKKFNVFEYNFPDKPLHYAHLLQADAIIFCAAAGVQSQTPVSESALYELNCFEVIRLFNFLDSNSYRGKLVTFGSYFELGNNEIAKLYTEAELLCADFKKPGHYSLAKSLLTKFLANQCHDHHAFSFYHLVLPNIYGKGENENRLIPYIINSIKNARPISLSEGKQVRQYINVKDISEFVIELTDRTASSGIYNISVKETLSVRTLSEKVISLAENKFDKKADVSFGSNNRQDVSMPFLALDSRKALALGWQPKCTIEEGINEYF